MSQLFYVSKLTALHQSKMPIDLHRGVQANEYAPFILVINKHDNELSTRIPLEVHNLPIGDFLQIDCIQLLGTPYFDIPVVAPANK